MRSVSYAVMVAAWSALAGVSSVQGAVKTWSGATSTDFTAAGNWDAGAPANSVTTDQALFTGAVGGAFQPALPAARSINKVTFDDSASGWDLGGPFILTVGSGSLVSGTTAAAANSNSISANILPNANQTWAALGASTLTINGVISGTRRVTAGSGAANGPTGTIVLTANNTSNGGFTAGSGTLRVIDTTANLGNTAVAKNAFGTGSVNLGNGFSAGTGNSPILQFRVNGAGDASAQVLSYANNFVLDNHTTIDVGNAGSADANKTIALGTLSMSVPTPVLTVTGSSGYKLSVAGVTMGGLGTTTDTGNYNLSPTSADMIIGSIAARTNSVRSPMISLGGSATGNVVTGVISDNTVTAYSTTRVDKAGIGAWRLSGANTYTAGTTVSAGTLRLDTNSSLGFGGMAKTTGTTSVAAAGTLDLSGVTLLQEPITLTGELTNSSADAATIGSGVAVVAPTAPGSYTAVPDVTLTGTGTGATAQASLGLLAANLTLTNGGSGYTANPSVTVSGGSGIGATFSATRTGDTITAISMTSGGTGYLPGDVITLTFTAAPAGGTTATATIDASTLGLTGVRVTNAGTGYTAAPAVSIGGGGATATATISSVTLTGAPVISGTGPIVIQGNVSGSGNLTKNGVNTLTFGGVNTNSGTTTINGGAILVNGTQTNAGAYTVEDGAALGGSGSIALANGRSITFAGSGANLAKLSPGNSAGLLTVTLQSNSSGAPSRLDLAGGEYVWQISSLADAGPNGITGAGAAFDQVSVLGTKTGSGVTSLLLDGQSSLAIAFDGVAAPTGSNPFWAADHLWKVIDVAAAINTVGTFSALQNATFAQGEFTSFVGDGTNGDLGDVYVQYTAVPEPASLALAGLAGMALLRRRRD